MPHFDVGLELYTAMLRVSKGGSPEDEVQRILGSAPETISMKGRARAARRVAVASLWGANLPVKDICAATGLSSAQAYSVIGKFRTFEKNSTAS